MVRAMSKTFFDYNSTTPVCPEALNAMLPYFSEVFANPSGQTSEMSWQSQSAIKASKKQIASLIGCSDSEITFTSGATESINWVFEDFQKRGLPILISDIDHDASFQKALQGKDNCGDFIFTSNTDGSVNLEDFSKKLLNLPEGALVSLLYAHNELGTILNLEEITSLVKEKFKQKKLLIHVDATQALGKFKFNFRKLKIDFLSCSAHKVYGPKGVGALVVNKDTISSISPFICGGGQQDGLRSGTLNTPLIVGFGKACEIASLKTSEDKAHYLKLKKLFLDEIKDLDFKLNGDLECSLANTINITFGGWKNLAPLFLELLPYSVSQSSACSTESNKKRILSSLDIPEAQTLRISFGRTSDEEAVSGLAQKIKSTLRG